MTLSKREQLLLFVMGLIAILIFFIVVFILPMNSRITNLRAEKTTLDSEKAIIDSTLPLGPVLKEQQTARAAEVNAQLAKIQSPILASEFERWVLPLTSKYDMRVLSATFSEPVLSTPSGNVLLVNSPVYGLRTMIETYTGEVAQVDATPESTSILMKSTYTYSFSTNYARFHSMLDDISAWNTTFFVTDASYNFSTGIVMLTIDAYTIHKISYEGDREYIGDYNATGDNSSGGPTDVVDGDPVIK
jgi:hypothetical protein